ncbi:glycohydrolase toxin TNT-related protein [Kutzneria albida]|uniref:TNT domain-containing protein n=1 Tax=Kutzneria albida DSM 43870 TaxID=1449976 RepID=W5WKY3_9PSEU|nr:glycohydrolase toxin TNT-related protein [Kutzneria albida]AHI01431.1 hypothetical protein KALB_8073 [Kutzneria albida DSM 43870]
MSQPTPLNPVEQDALVKQIGLALMKAAPQDWEQVRAEYRAAGRYFELSAEVTAQDGQVRAWTAPQETATLFARLRAGMYREGRGTWFNAKYQLDRPSSYNLDFDREEPQWQSPPPPPAYTDEVRFFPRTDDNVPEWLARRLQAGARPAGPPPGVGQRFRTARIFDGPGPDGRPSVNRPPLDPGEVDKVLDYLEAAPVALTTQGMDSDRLAHENPEAIPIAFHTDGAWIWPAAVIFYLARYNVPPEPELVQHIRANNFQTPDVDEPTRSAAAGLLGTMVAGRPPQPPAPPQAPATQVLPTPQPVAEPEPPAAPEPPAQEPVAVRPPEPEAAEPAPQSSPSAGHRSAGVAELRHLLADLDVPESAYRIGEPEPNTWYLERVEDGWQVGWYEHGYSTPMLFDDENDAAAFLLGKLLLDRRAEAPSEPVAAEPELPKVDIAPVPVPIPPVTPALAGIPDALAADLSRVEQARAAEQERADQQDGFEQPRGGFEPPRPEQGGFQRPEPGAFGAEPGGFEPPHGEPQRPEHGGFEQQRPEPGAFEAQRNDQGGFDQQRPEHGGSDQQRGEHGGFEPPRPEQGGFEPPRPEPGGFGQPRSDQQQALNEHGGFEHQRPEPGGFGPQRSEHGGFDPQRPEPGAFEPQHGEPASFDQQRPEPGTFDAQRAEHGGFDQPLGDQQRPEHGGFEHQRADQPRSEANGFDPQRAEQQRPEHGGGFDQQRASQQRGEHGGFDQQRADQQRGEHGGFEHQRADQGGFDPQQRADQQRGEHGGFDQPRGDQQRPEPGGFDAQHADQQRSDQRGGFDPQRGDQQRPEPGGFDQQRGDQRTEHGGFEHQRGDQPRSEASGFDPQRAEQQRPEHGGGFDPQRAEQQGGFEPPRGEQQAPVQTPPRPPAPQQSLAAQQAQQQQPSRPEEWAIQPLRGEPPLTLFRGKRIIELPIGVEVDRFGQPDGNLTYAGGTPFPLRSLVPDWVNRPYHVYRLQQPVQALAGVAVPWFGQPGGGTAYMLAKSIDELLAEGTLVEVRHGTPPPTGK